jgi:thiol:disulfide interchange protein DsbA
MLVVRAGLVACVIALLFFPAGYAAAQQTEILRAEIDYRPIDPQPVGVTEGVEVIDFFWYGCPHCNNLQPYLERWISRKPSDVTVRRIPAVLRESWAPHARIYYTLEALGEVERLHQQVYHGYHVEKLSMSKPEVMTAWAVRHGIMRERWDETYASAAVQLKVEEAAKLTRTYKITGTPSLVVQGRYLTSGNMVESLERMVVVMDGLVHRVRDQASAR